MERHEGYMGRTSEECLDVLDWRRSTLRLYRGGALFSHEVEPRAMGDWWNLAPWNAMGETMGGWMEACGGRELL